MTDYIKVFLIEVIYGIYMMRFGIKTYKMFKGIK